MLDMLTSGPVMCGRKATPTPSRLEQKAEENESGVGQRSALMLLCCNAAMARQIMTLNAAGSLPTLVHGQAIRGHYRAGDELVIHARPCLALLFLYLGALPGVQHLRILGALHLSRLRTYTYIDRQDAGAALASGFAACIMPESASACERHVF
jgi:hypothetical protein